MESVIAAHFDKIELALKKDDLDVALKHAVDLDREIRIAVETGRIASNQLKVLLERFEGVLKQLQLAKKVKLAEMSKLSKGTVGIKAYKGV